MQARGAHPNTRILMQAHKCPAPQGTQQRTSRQGRHEDTWPKICLEDSDRFVGDIDADRVALSDPVKKLDHTALVLKIHARDETIQNHSLTHNELGRTSGDRY